MTYLRVHCVNGDFKNAYFCVFPSFSSKKALEVCMHFHTTTISVF